MLPDHLKTGIASILAATFLIYSWVLYTGLPVANYSQSLTADRGKQLWQQHNCGACHQVYGLGGFLGPDLTNVYSVRGAGYIEAFVKAGNQTMPAFNLADGEMSALISYLKEVDASGNADPRSFRIIKDGTIEQ